MYKLKKAAAVWGSDLINTYNQFLGFYTRVNYTGKVKLAIAARSYYRLYINGKMIASGPARTAEHYCRVDEITAELAGESDIAVEVVALSKPEKYCNDCTMEPGLFLCEITGENGEVLSATGSEICASGSETCATGSETCVSESETCSSGSETSAWKYTEITYRRSLVETMSHSRGILEYYDLAPESYKWQKGIAGYTGTSDWKTPVLLEEKVGYLPRNAKYATYQPVMMDALTGIGDVITDETMQAPSMLMLAALLNPAYYAMIPEENKIIDRLTKEKSIAFTGQMKRLPGLKLEVIPGENPAGCIWERRESELGFIHFTITVEEDCVVDVINTDHRGMYGNIRGNAYVSRYHLAPALAEDGSKLPAAYDLTTFEPKLTRYIKLVFRTKGKVIVSRPQLLQDTYPDDKINYFTCSDGDLNRIYDGARRTLRLNTLDIYMDCPQRERGGWLCDSQFNGPGSWTMFGDLNVEHDFIENFMLTDPDVLWKSFFPEVYPGVHQTPEAVGISNWSFWLITELYDYYQRSGDRDFVDKYAYRVSRFIEGMLTLKGESGLLENLPSGFVDWSLSNKDFNMSPINIPNNCLAVCLLERMSQLYGREDWAKEAADMRAIIEAIPQATISFMPDGDAAVLQNGHLSRTGCITEAGMALELWSGFHLQDKSYIQKFVNALGPVPEYRSNPNIGRTNLFIGLMIRFEVLARLGRIGQLVKELKDIYLQELRDGSGTFFENIHGLSGCHAFNSEAGALIVNQVLGLGQPMQSTKTFTLCPHPARLRWANGTAVTCDGTIFIEWSSEPDDHVLDIRLQLPEGWKYEFVRPFELCGWTIQINGENI